MEEAAEASLVHQERIVGVHHEACPFIGEEPERGVLPVAEEYFRRDAIQLAGLHVRRHGPPLRICTGQIKQEARANRPILGIAPRVCPRAPGRRWGETSHPSPPRGLDRNPLRIRYLRGIQRRAAGRAGGNRLPYLLWEYRLPPVGGSGRISRRQCSWLVGAARHVLNPSCASEDDGQVPRPVAPVRRRKLRRFAAE